MIYNSFISFESIIFSCLVLSILSVGIAYRVWGIKTAIVSVLIKYGLFAAYYLLFFNPDWMLKDDIVYFTESYFRLYLRFHNPFSALLDPSFYTALFWNSKHVVYYWWNFLSFYLFGPYYHSPIVLNLFAHTVACVCFYRILVEKGFSQPYAKWASIFWYLYWEVLTWGSLLNMKDLLIASMVVILFYQYMLYSKTRRLVHGFLFVLLLSLFIVLRVYMVPVILLSLYLGQFVQGKKQLFKSIVFVGLGGVFGWVLITYFGTNLGRFINVPGIVFNLFKMFFSPMPFSISDTYSFLMISTILRWVLLIPFLIGLALLAKKRKLAEYIVFLFVLFIFHSLIPEIVTPRKRLPGSFVLAWAYFHFFVVLFKSLIHHGWMQRGQTKQ